jgi:exopolysaccharide production protein ExoZ
LPESGATDHSNASVRGSRTLHSIQILRALAALAVLTHHVCNEKVAHVGGAPAPLNNLAIGVAGVDLFFVISGFVMVYASESLFGQRGAPRVFFLRRLARIVPLYWAVTSAIIVYLLAAHGAAILMTLHSPGGLIASFLFIPYPRLDGYVSPVHILGWTLNYEMFFYVIFTAAILLPRRAAVIAITALFIALTAIGRAVALPQSVAFWFDPIILEFCLGMGLALAYREGMRLPRVVSWLLVLAAIAIFAATTFLDMDARLRALYWGVPSAAIVAALVLSRDAAPPGAVGRAFGFLGDASYSIYLTHALVFPVVGWTLPRLIDFSAFRWAYAAIAMLCAIAGAFISYLLFEKPVTRWLQRMIGHAGKTSVQQPALSGAADAATTLSRPLG